MKRVNSFLTGILAAGVLSLPTQFCAAQNVQPKYSITGHGTGIYGQVYLVPLVGDKIQYETTLDIYARYNGRIVRVERIATENDGTFFVALPPGNYGLEPDTTDPWVMSTDVVLAAVKTNRVTVVEVDIDSWVP